MIDRYIEKEPPFWCGGSFFAHFPAREEIVADGMELVLTDGTVLNELARENKTLWQKIKDRIFEIIEKIKKAYGDLSKTSRTAQILSETVDSLDDIEQLFYEGVTEAGERTRTAEIGETVGNGNEIIYSSTENFKEDKYFKSQMAKWENLKHGSYVKVGTLGEGSPLCQVGMPSGTIRYDVDKLKRNMTDHDDYLTVELLNKIPNILANPVAISEYSQENTISVFGDVFVGKSPMMVGVTISHDRAGNEISKVRTYNTRRDVGNLITDETVLYLGEDKKRTREWFQACGIQVPLGGTKFGFIRSIAQRKYSVNSKFSISEENSSDTAYLAAVERGDMDTAQKMVDEAAKAEGYINLFYHGAKKGGGFTVFRDWSYFTENKAYAERYTDREKPSSLYKTYVKMDKPFDTRKTKDRRLFAQIRDEYGLGEIQDTGLPDWTDGYDISDYIDENDLDYDGIILDEGGDLVDGVPISRGLSYVVRKSAQIKSADPVTYDDNGNMIPLSERFKEDNSDIRYSIDENPETPDVSDSPFDAALRRAGLSHLVEDTAETGDTETATPPRKAPQERDQQLTFTYMRKGTSGMGVPFWFGLSNWGFADSRPLPLAFPSGEGGAPVGRDG